MNQGENKQIYYDESHPQAIEKRMRQMRDLRRQIFKRSIDKQKEAMYPQTEKLRELKQINKLQAERRTIQAKTAQLEHPAQYKLKQLGSKAYEQVGEGAASKVSQVFSGIKKFLVGEMQAQGQISRKAISQDQQQRMAYMKQQKAMVDAKRKIMLSNRMRQINAQRQAQRQVRAPQQYNAQRLNPNQIRALNQMRYQQMIRQQQMAQQQRLLQRTLTPGFYNPRAERINPFGLASRYKMNFGQNIFTERDPENQKVHINGKYKWRAD